MQMLLPFNVRQVNLSSDLQAIAKLGTQLGYPSTPDQVLCRLRDNGPHNPVFVAVDNNDSVLGWISLRIEKSPVIDPRVEVSALVVDESARGQNIGRLLMERAESWALDQGFLHICLRSRTHRSEAHRFYEKLGYRVTKTSHVFEKSLFGEMAGPNHRS